MLTYRLLFKVTIHLCGQLPEQARVPAAVAIQGRQGPPAAHQNCLARLAGCAGDGRMRLAGQRKTVYYGTAALGRCSLCTESRSLNLRYDGAVHEETWRFPYKNPGSPHKGFSQGSSLFPS